MRLDLYLVTDPDLTAGRGTKAADLSFETRRRFMKLLAEANREHGYRE